MKTISLIFFLSLITTRLFSQWTDINPIPDGNDIWSGYFVQDSVGWIVGSGGFIKKTTNAGKEWSLQTGISNSTLKSVKFFNKNLGFICGEQGTILKSTNGGNDWFQLFSGTTENLNSVCMIDSNTIYITGDNGIFLKTSNGGLSWTSVSLGNSIKLKSVFFINDMLGYTIGMNGKCFKTTDGGLSWIDKSPYTGLELLKFNKVYFINSDTGWIGAGDEYEGSGLFFHTTNGGETWNQQNVFSLKGPSNKNNHIESLDDSYGIRDIFFLDNNHGYAVSGSGGGWSRSIFITTNGGNSWISKYYTLEEYGLLSINVTNSGFGIAAGFNGSLFRTTDFGNSWSQLLSGGIRNPGEEKINTIKFISDSVGFAAGSRNSFNMRGDLILKTVDGGKNWFTNYYNYSSSDEITDIFFIDNEKGFAGSEGKLVMTSDGGDTWLNLSAGINNIKSLFFLDANSAYMSAEDGIYKSTDGGVSWTVKSTPGGNSIYFSDSLNGWVAGNNGNIRKTTDGGETWISKYSGTVSDLKSIKFYNNNLGAVAGNNGTFLISTDGGENWLSRNTNTNTIFNSITFIDANSIWLVGDNGTILFTDDLGNTWTNYSNITNKNLKSIYKKNDYSVFIAGHQGAMLRYFNNTQQPPMHFIKNWSGNPYLPMNIYITSAKIENASLKAGDEIAVFSSGNCVGSIRLNDSIPQNGFVQIITSLDDPTTNELDGFIPNDTIVFKFWNSQTQQEIELVIASYTQGTGRFIQQGTSVVDLNGYNYLTQSVGLTGGWNIISLNVQPENINMMSIFNSLISGDVLIKVQDETGNAIEKLPEPIGWINNIGNWSPTEGYYTKIQPNSAASLITTGIKVPLPQNIILTNGWNIISYPVQTEQNALLILQDLINNGKLVKVQDEAGNAIEYLPEPIGWINNIGNFKPGEGYYLKVNSIASLTYTEFALPKSIEFNKNIIAEKNNTVHFSQIWSDNPYLPMNIYLTDFNLPDGSSLIQGDEIGIFCSDICIGVSQISQNDLNRGYIQIILSADDPTTNETDGFVAGNSIIVKVWKANQNQLITISNPVFLSGSEFFEPLGTAVIRFNTVIPVELISFDALVNNSDVRLSWSTSTESNNRGFEIERGQKLKVKSQIDWESIGFINGKGTTTETQNYSFVDKNLLPGKYYYRLKQIDFDGKFSYSEMIEVNVDLPTEFALEQNYPNPFNPSTKISWQSPVGSWQTLKVFDILGNEVATLVDEYKEAGRYEVEFDASDLSSGVYIYRLQADAFISTKKMVLLR